jgi:hypothetical protein
VKWIEFDTDTLETDDGAYTINRSRSWHGEWRYLAWKGKTSKSKVSKLIDGFHSAAAAKMACEKDQREQG